MIISRYLTKEVFNTLIAVTFVLLLIFLSNQLVRYLGYAASGKIAASVVLQIMGFEIPYLLALLLPLGLFLGIILTYGRLYADNELRVMMAYGLSPRALLSITCYIGLVVALVIMILMFWVNPFLASAKDNLLNKHISKQNLLEMLMPGRFQLTGDDRRVVYVEKITRDHKEAQNLFIADQKATTNDTEIASWNVISAARGYQIRDPKTHERFVVATDGYRYEGTPGQNQYKIIQFKKYSVRIPDKEIDVPREVQEVMSTWNLWTHYQNPHNAAEFQWRFSIPLSAFLLAILAIPFGYTRPRQNRYARLFPAILIYVVYMNLLLVMRDWVDKAKLTSSLGMWWVHIAFILLIVLVYFYHGRRFSWFAKQKIVKRVK